MLNRLAWIATLGVLLAGCAAAAPEPKAASPTPVPKAPDPVVDETTGAIVGTVTDDELRPVPTARVGLQQDLERTTFVDSAGAFTLSDLPPGRYHVIAQALGYEDTVRIVQVAAGEVTETTLPLTPLPVEVPHPVYMRERGVAACFASYKTPATAVGNVYCGHAHDSAGLNRHRIFWPTLKPTQGWQDSVFEMEWKSNQVAGGGMQGKLYIANCGELTFFEGRSPLHGRAKAGSIEDITNKKTGTCPTQCNVNECKLESWVGGMPFLFNGSQQADVGLLLDQPFDHHHTAFFYQDAPADYSALNDS